jgi:arabinofuranan 3-O-arabinosyltransferase
MTAAETSAGTTGAIATAEPNRSRPTAERQAGSRPARRIEPLAVQRLRLATISLALTVLVFAQSAGLTASDTKLDLAVDPAGLLRRSLTLWDPTAASGSLQNQAYGYLFPMGPFFALGKLVALPAWEVQRAWESLLVVAAFLGVVRLSRLLGTATFWPKVAAGLTYALAPRMLSELGSISAELMPVAVLPWVLIPLVRGARGGSPRRQAGLAGVALLFAGGVNAAATLAILPVPVLWLLTRQRGPRRRALAGWFTVAVVLSTAWWAIPLVLLGKYSPPFLDWIESSQVTTSVTSLAASLRGVDHWQAYLGPSIWPAGWILVAVPAVIVCTAVVPGAGLLGIARADAPERSFLLLCLLLGLCLVGLGFVAGIGPATGSVMRTLLDGPLQAFRNIHKFDPLIRLPIAVGVGHFASRLTVPRIVRLRSLRLHARPLALLLVLVVAGLAISPAVTNNLIPSGRSTTEASWWQQTGSWLGRNDGAGRALVVPGASRPVYNWGSTVDDALQPVATGPWAVRDGIPLAPAGYIRLLDSVSLKLAAGTRDDSLPALLARSGIHYLIVRNDLDTLASGSTNLAYVHATIAATPGLPLVASFGPDNRFTAPAGQLVDAGATTPLPMVQIYRVQSWSGQVALLPAAATVASTGAADNLAALLGTGIATPDSPVVFGGTKGQSVIGDGTARREVNFGQTGVSYPTMSADQPYLEQRREHDYLPTDPGQLSTVAYGGGITAVSASSSGADPGAAVNLSPASEPWSALDSNAATAWKSGSFSGAVGQWLSVRLAAATAVTEVHVAFASGLGGYPDRVRVRTDAGSANLDVIPGPQQQALALPPGPTHSLRITVLDASPGALSVGISSLQLPGIVPTRTLVVPTVSAAPDAFAFAAAPGYRSGCLTVSGRAACDPSFAAQSESDGVIDRTFTLPAAQDYQLRATVAAQPGAALDSLLDAGAGTIATASSVDSADPRERAGAAVDGDPKTGWVAAPGDLHPSVTLALPATTEVSTVHLATDPLAPVARPTKVAVSVAGRRFQLKVPASGVLRLPEPVGADSLTITVLTAQLRLDSSTMYAAQRLLPAGISEISINGQPNRHATGALQIACGTGLQVQLGSRQVSVAATATRQQLLTGASFAAVPCPDDTGVLALASGVQHLRVSAAGTLTPLTVTLQRPGSQTSPPASAGTASVTDWHATRRRVEVSTTEPAVLAISENANAGWQATVNGTKLVTVTLDGWKQGWMLPAGVTGTVRLDYAPQRSFTAGLVIGAVGVFALGLLVLVRGRRTKSQSAPVLAAAVPAWRYGALATVGATLLAGWFGLLVSSVILGSFVLLPGPRSRTVRWLPGALLVLAGLAEAIRPSGKADPLAGSSWLQALCVIAVVLAVLAAVEFRQPGLEKRRSRGLSMNGQDSEAIRVDEAPVSKRNAQKWP